MSEETPLWRASGERPTQMSPSPEPTTAVRHPRTFNPDTDCGAKTNPIVGELPCKQRKGIRTDHVGSGQCWLHGGRSRNGRAHAATEASAAALKSLGRPRAVAPQRALLETVWEAAGNVEFLREEARALGVDLVLRTSEMAQQRSDVAMENPDGSVTHAAGRMVTIREDIHAVVKLYGEWCDRLVKYAKAAVDAGLAEREVRLAEDQAAQIVRVIEATFAGIDLSPEQCVKGRAVAIAQLRLLAANPQFASRN